MFREKAFKIKSGLLLIIPVYLFFLNNSMQGYHSHVNANGIIITHSNCADDCSFPTTDSDDQKDDKQIIIFHGFMQICGDNVEQFRFNEYLPQYSTEIEIPQQIIHCSQIPGVKKGRAPPKIV